MTGDSLDKLFSPGEHPSVVSREDVSSLSTPPSTTNLVEQVGRDETEVFSRKQPAIPAGSTPERAEKREKIPVEERPPLYRIKKDGRVVYRFDKNNQIVQEDDGYRDGEGASSVTTAFTASQFISRIRPKPQRQAEVDIEIPFDEEDNTKGLDIESD